MDCDSKAVNRRPLGEIIAVLATGGIYLVFENILNAKLVFLIPCVILWSVYIVIRLVKKEGVAKAWGLASPAAGLSSFAICLVGGVGVLGAFRAFKGFEPLPPGAVWIFLLYPVWAFIQQFVVQAMVASNLEQLGWKRPGVVIVTAVLFGVAHAPDLPLMGLCVVAGLVWTSLFLGTRNLYALAVTHAVLGALAYYWVLERDPWLEMFRPATS